MVGHVAPEAFGGGPIALVRDGDTVVIDVENRRLDMEVDEDELAARAGRVEAARSRRYTTGVLAKYAAIVGSASEGSDAPDGASTRSAAASASRRTPPSRAARASRCFGPLDPVYDWDAVAREVSREQIEAGPRSLWRYAALLPVAVPGRRERPRLDAARRARRASRRAPASARPS